MPITATYPSSPSNRLPRLGWTVLLFVVTFLSIRPATTAAQQSATVHIDASEELRQIQPFAIGGNAVFNRVSTLYKIAEAFAEDAMGAMSWRVFFPDDGFGWRWDTQTFHPNSRHLTWLGSGGLNGLVHRQVKPGESYENFSDVVDFELDNHFVVDYWDGTDMRHSGILTKSAAGANAYRKISLTPRARVGFLRFDLKISGQRPFRAVDAGWILARVRGVDSHLRFELRLDDNRHLIIANAGGQPLLTTPAPLPLDQWTSIEAYYGDGEVALWIDHLEVGRQPASTQDWLTALEWGSVESATEGVEGQIHLDALRLDEDYIGAAVHLPWQHPYNAHFTFDNTLRTIDDVATIAETLGATLVWCIPLANRNHPDHKENRSGSAFDFQTQQFFLDQVEYLVGTADADYQAAVASLDWDHQTPTDNWANLRAARGRLEPYDITYFEIGNEPYFGGRWRDDLSDYGQVFLDYSRGIKTIHPSAKVGHHSFKSAPDNWLDTLLPITKEEVDFISIFHDYPFQTEAPIEHWLGIPVGDNNRWRFWVGNKGSWIKAPYGNMNDQEGDRFFFTPFIVRHMLEKHVPERAAAIELLTTEYGHFLAPGKGEDNWLGSAINRASFIGANIASGVDMAQVWSLASSGGFAMGLVVDKEDFIEKPPHYQVFKLWANHFGTHLVPASVETPLKPFRFLDKQQTGNGFDIPYFSAWASLNAERDKLFVVFINRHQQDAVDVDFALNHFELSDRARTFMINGDDIGDDNEIGNIGERLTWFLPAGDGSDDPENIVIREETVDSLSNPLRLTLPKLSVTALELSGQVKIVLPEGDFNGDQAVDFGDFFLLADHFNLRQEDAGFTPVYDLNQDGAIDLGDFFIFADRLVNFTP